MSCLLKIVQSKLQNNSMKQKLSKNLKKSQCRIKQLQDQWTILINMYPKNCMTRVEKSNYFSLCLDQSSDQFDISQLVINTRFFVYHTYQDSLIKLHVAYENFVMRPSKLHFF